MIKANRMFPIELYNKGLVFQGFTFTNKNNVGNNNVSVPSNTQENDLLITVLMTKATTISDYEGWTTALYIPGWNSGSGKMKVLFKPALSKESKNYSFTCNVGAMLAIRYADKIHAASYSSCANAQNSLSVNRIPGTFFLTIYASEYGSSIAFTPINYDSILIPTTLNGSKLGFGACLLTQPMTIQRSTTQDTMVAATLGLI